MLVSSLSMHQTSAHANNTTRRQALKLKTLQLVEGCQQLLVAGYDCVIYMCIVIPWLLCSVIAETL